MYMISLIKIIVYIHLGLYADLVVWIPVAHQIVIQDHKTQDALNQQLQQREQLQGI
jgi:hypothetical protein